MSASPEIASAKGRMACLARDVNRGRARPEALRHAQAEVARLKAEKYIAELLAAAPPLSPEQADLIGHALREALAKQQATKPTAKRHAS